MSEVTLYHGDCLDILPTLPDASVDMVLCDLPYGTTACKWDVVIPFAPLWEQYRRVVKRNGAIVLFGSQPFTSALVMSNPSWFKCEWIWEKNVGSNWGSTRFMPMKEHENILVFSSTTPTYNPQRIERAPSGLARIKYPIKHDRSERFGAVYRTFKDEVITEHTIDRNPRSIIRFNREMGLHPTQKPVALCEYLIRTYTNEGDTVLDNTMGSGTTGVACVNTGRAFVGIEKSPVPDKPIHPKDNPDYYGVAWERVESAQSAVRQLEFSA